MRSKISPFCSIVSISSLTCAYTGAGITQLILGSSSASRRQILSEMGYKFTLIVVFFCALSFEMFALVISSPAPFSSFIFFFLRGL
jgi:septum formation protein